MSELVNLADKINRTKDVRLLAEIVNIIRKNDKDVPFTENENGLFIKFNLLSHATHKKISALLYDKS